MWDDVYELLVQQLAAEEVEAQAVVRTEGVGEHGLVVEVCTLAGHCGDGSDAFAMD